MATSPCSSQRSCRARMPVASVPLSSRRKPNRIAGRNSFAQRLVQVVVVALLPVGVELTAPQLIGRSCRLDPGAFGARAGRCYYDLRPEVAGDKRGEQRRRHAEAASDISPRPASCRTLAKPRIGAAPPASTLSMPRTALRRMICCSLRAALAPATIRNLVRDAGGG